MTSTNFTTSTFFEEFYGLLNVLGKYKTRNFEFDLQLSIDGPENLNDFSRGNGVTKNFIQHFDEMLRTAPKMVPPNVTLTWHFKGTLDSHSIAELQTKEAIINYYKFFETFYEKMEKVKTMNFTYFPTIPNTACPSPHTQDDGIRFANLCKLCRQIEKEHIFKYHTYITPFAAREHYKKFKTYKCAGGICGTGKFCVGLLPYDMISCCHNGFVDLISDYKILSNQNKSNTILEFKFFANDKERNRMVFPKEQLAIYERQIENFYHPNTTTRIANIANLINLLARTRQIDEKYQDRKLAMEAAYYIQESTSYCIRDNLNVTGSIALYPVGLLKLLLNGARDYIEQAIEL